MSIPLSLAVILLALDGPVGLGIPPVLGRFGGNATTISAVFARNPADPMPELKIDWFLDGDTLAAPVAKSGFLLTRKPAGNPLLTEGTFQVDLPISAKVENYRGVIFAIHEKKAPDPLAEIQLAVFPPDHFVAAWQELANSTVPVTLVGDLPGLRDFLQNHEIAFTEGDANDPGSIDRSGLLVVDASNEKNFVIPPGLARAVLIFSAPDRSWQFEFAMQENGNTVLWTRRHLNFDFAQDPLAQAQFLNLAQTLLHKSKP